MTRVVNSFVSLTGAKLALGMCLVTSLWAASFSFTTGAPDGRLGAAVPACQPWETRDGDGR